MVEVNGVITHQYGEFIDTDYVCPCGNGVVNLYIENLPNFFDWAASIKCDICRTEYELKWGKGVYPGDSPMIHKINN